MKVIQKSILFNIKCFIISFLLGVCLLPIFYYHKIFICLILLFILLYFYCLYLNSHSKQLKSLLLWLILNLFGIFLGFGWIWLNENVFHHQRSLSYSLEGKLVLVQGKILELTSIERQYFKKASKCLQFDLKIHKIFNQSTNHKVRLKWVDPNTTVLPGDYWQFYVRLKKPRNFSTNGSFDLEKHLFVQRIEMVGNVIKSSNNILIKHNKFSSVIKKTRQFIINKINNSNFDEQLKNKGIMLALGLGLKNYIDVKDTILFQDTGTAHLLSISGLHIGIVSGLIFVIVNYMFKQLSSISSLEKVPSTIVAAIASMVGATIYANVAGLSIATTRSLIMTNLYFTGMILRKIIATDQIYFLAIMATLIIDPFAVLDIGFWFSFVAVGILLYSYKGITNQENYKKSIMCNTIINLLKTNWLMLVGLLPINILFFRKISLIAYVANFVAVPLINFLVLPWVLIGLLLLYVNINIAKYFFVFADYNLQVLLWLLKFLATVPYSTIEVVEPSWAIFFVSCIGSILLTIPKGLLNKYLSIICFLPIFFRHPVYPEHGDVFVSFLDVGQGLATIIKLKNHILLYDTGPNNKVVLNYLKSLKYKSIDQVIISHTDLDHIGGLEDLIINSMVKRFATNMPNYKINNLTGDLCKPDYSWKLDGVEFEFLQINNNDANKILNKNDNSCVLQMRTRQHNVLFTGDISQKLEKLLIAKYSNKLKSDVLLIPHHGSRSSSSEQFIKIVDPKYAVVSAGYMNMYGHPRAEVLAKYLSKNIKVLNTIKYGSIEFKFKTEKLVKLKQTDWGETIEYNCYRIINRNFWNY